MMWRTKNGDVVYLKEMTTTHIENCIKYIKKVIENRPQVYSVDSDSDGAYFAHICEERQNDEREEELNKIIEEMEEELFSRNPSS